MGMNEGNYVDSISTKIRELIGTFDLDPNRVLDVMVQNFIYHCCDDDDGNNNMYYIDLLKEFKTDSIPHLLGYVLKEQRNNKKNNNNDTISLYKTCAYFAIQNLYPIE